VQRAGSRTRSKKNNEDLAPDGDAAGSWGSFTRIYKKIKQKRTWHQPLPRHQKHLPARAFAGMLCMRIWINSQTKNRRHASICTHPGFDYDRSVPGFVETPKPTKVRQMCIDQLVSRPCALIAKRVDAMVHTGVHAQKSACAKENKWKLQAALQQHEIIIPSLCIEAHDRHELL
jgi:hypothetical protein